MTPLKYPSSSELNATADSPTTTSSVCAAGAHTRAELRLASIGSTPTGKRRLNREWAMEESRVATVGLDMDQPRHVHERYRRAEARGSTRDRGHARTRTRRRKSPRSRRGIASAELRCARNRWR